jgi:hypothetical protein
MPERFDHQRMTVGPAEEGFQWLHGQFKPDEMPTEILYEGPGHLYEVARIEIALYPQRDRNLFAAPTPLFEVKRKAGRSTLIA